MNLQIFHPSTCTRPHFIRGLTVCCNSQLSAQLDVSLVGFEVLVDQPSGTLQTLRWAGGNRGERHRHGCACSTSLSIMISTNFQKLSLHTDISIPCALDHTYKESRLSLVPLYNGLGTRVGQVNDVQATLWIAWLHQHSSLSPWNTDVP